MEYNERKTTNSDKELIAQFEEENLILRLSNLMREKEIQSIFSQDARETLMHFEDLKNRLCNKNIKPQVYTTFGESLLRGVTVMGLIVSYLRDWVEMESLENKAILNRAIMSVAQLKEKFPLLSDMEKRWNHSQKNPLIKDLRDSNSVEKDKSVN